jgi:hypothetical protein
MLLRMIGAAVPPMVPRDSYAHSAKHWQYKGLIEGCVMRLMHAVFMQLSCYVTQKLLK